MAADRRLTYPDGRYCDNATKIFRLSTADAEALVAYSGLGATSSGLELSQWLSNTLRGRNMTIEDSINLVANSMYVRFPRQLIFFNLNHHQFIFSYYRKRNPYVKIITMNLDKTPRVIIDNIENGVDKLTPLVVCAGSGRAAFAADRSACRRLVTVLRRHRAHRVSDNVTAAVLASCIAKVGRSLRSVSQSSVVATIDPNGGGSHHMYGHSFEVMLPSAACDALPTIARGMDVEALATSMLRVILPFFAQVWRNGVPTAPPEGAWDTCAEQLKAAVASLPDTPNDDLV